MKRAKVDLKAIKALNPCQDRLDNYTKHYGDKSYTIKQFLALKNITHADKCWVAFRLMPKKNIRFATGEIANSVLGIYEDKYPDDKRPREAIKQTLAKRMNKNAAYAAAYAAYDAVYAAAYADNATYYADNATYAAAYAANAAANAANAAANAANAANAAAYADNDAYAAANAANAAAYAAANAANAAANREGQYLVNLKIIAKYWK